MPSLSPSRSRPNGICLADCLFIFLAACYAYLAGAGVIELSGAGAVMDSDLQTYAQGMAGASHPDLFAADPLLHAATPANSIPNLERIVGGWLAPPDQWAVGLLRAGACAIFLFYCGWYLLGRWLYGAPSLASLLAVACGVTVWVGWGTFWGVTHSDPVPRVFFGALMPFLLLLAFYAVLKPAFRPLAMLASGLAIWVHGVSALNLGAMLFMGFLCLPGPNANLKSHVFNLFLCLIAFFIPVLLFLWPSLAQSSRFSPDELSAFQQLFELRWHEDYGEFGRRMQSFFSISGQVFPILATGLTGLIITAFLGSKRQKLICKLAPCYLAALLCVAIFSWLEADFAPKMGRLPLGHELVRGMRLLVPIAWLLAVAGMACLSGKISRRFILTGAIIAALLLTQDRQYAAAQYAISQKTGISLPLADPEQVGQAKKMAELMKDINRIVPRGEAVYCPEDAMPVRYLALRPLSHSFKDGYAHFYNKDLSGTRKWLELERLNREGPNGFLNAWRESHARWLLCRDNADRSAIAKEGEIVLDQNGWLLARSKNN